MTTKSWIFRLDNQRHTVELDHGRFSGHRIITLDGQVIHKSRKLFDTGSEHHFQIGNYPCAVIVRTNGFTFDYEFTIDGFSIPPGREISLTTEPGGDGLRPLEALEKRPAHFDLIDRLNKGVRSWGIFSILLGFIHLFASGTLNSSWGILLILVGLGSFFFRAASMYVVYAVVLAWAGILNLLSQDVQWMVFAGIQFLLTIQILRQFGQFKRASLVKNEKLQEQGVIQYSRAESIFPWASFILGGVAISLFIGLLGGLILLAIVNPGYDLNPYENAIDFAINLVVNIGVLALGLGLAANLSGFRRNILSVLGFLAGVAIIALDLLIFLLL